MLTTVTAALALWVVSATLVAVTVCAPDMVGAVYRPLVLTVPTVRLPPFTPSTDQVTPVLLVFVTVAVNCCDVLTAKVAVVGEIVTLTPGGGGLTVTAALAVLVVSALAIAVTVT